MREVAQRVCVSTKDVLVRPLAEPDRPAYWEMWAQYNAFYETAISQNVTLATWKRLLDAESSVNGLVAVERASGALLGFANYVVHPYTWSERQACYLEDLFVRPAARGRGIGRALMERLISLAAPAGFDRLYWLTREGNLPARRLYDRMGERDDSIRYEVKMERPAPLAKEVTER